MSIKNILYVIVDDLRPQLGAYGKKEMHTPNFDKLANKSTLFDRAYVQVALCGPTRQSFLSGRRPDVAKIYDFGNNFREVAYNNLPPYIDSDKWWPLPQIFREAGHLSLGTGKVYHPNCPPNFDGSNSWSPEALDGRNGGYRDFADDDCPDPPAGVVNATQYTPDQVGGQSRWERGVRNGFSDGLNGCARTTFQDPNVTANAIRLMGVARKEEKPFFLAVGEVDGSNQQAIV